MKSLENPYNNPCFSAKASCMSTVLGVQIAPSQHAAVALRGFSTEETGFRRLAWGGVGRAPIVRLAGG